MRNIKYYILLSIFYLCFSFSVISLISVSLFDAISNAMFIDKKNFKWGKLDFKLFMRSK